MVDHLWILHHSQPCVFHQSNHKLQRNSTMKANAGLLYSELVKWTWLSACAICPSSHGSLTVRTATQSKSLTLTPCHLHIGSFSLETPSQGSKPCCSNFTPMSVPLEALLLTACRSFPRANQQSLLEVFKTSSMQLHNVTALPGNKSTGTSKQRVSRQTRMKVMPGVAVSQPCPTCRNLPSESGLGRIA